MPPIRTPSHRSHPYSKAPLHPVPPFKAPPQQAEPRPSGLTPLIPTPPPSCPSSGRSLPYLKGPRPSRPGLPAALLYWPLGGRGAARRGAARALARLREARKAQSSPGRSGKAPTGPRGLPPAELRCPGPATLLSAAAPRPARPHAGGCFSSPLPPAPRAWSCCFRAPREL